MPRNKFGQSLSSKMMVSFCKTSAEELPPWFLERENITQRPPGKAVYGACVLQSVG